MRHQELTKKLIDEIQLFAVEKLWERLPGDFDALAEELVSALVAGRDDDLSFAYDTVEIAYSRLLIKFGLVDAAPDERRMAGQLESFTRLLAVALHHRRPPEQADLIAKHSRILLALKDAEKGLSGRELAEKLGGWPEDVARDLPVLRAAGLVDSVRVGKSIINTVTDEAIRRLSEKDANTFKPAGAKRSGKAFVINLRMPRSPQPANDALDALQKIENQAANRPW